MSRSVRISDQEMTCELHSSVMEREDCVDSVTDLACILEIFFKGLSECGLLSTYSVQLQAAVSDMTVHLKFRQHIYHIMKSLQGLLQRISRIPGGKSITSDRATQTEDKLSSSAGSRPVFRSNRNHKVSLTKLNQRVTSQMPLSLPSAMSTSRMSTKTLSESSGLPISNLLGPESDLSGSLRECSPISSVSENLSSHSPTVDVACSPDEITSLSVPSKQSIVSHSEFTVDSSRQLNVRNFSPQLQIIDGKKSISNKKIYSTCGSLIYTTAASCNNKNNSINPHILASQCSQFSNSNQIHALSTSSELVTQDLIAVLGSEDASDQQPSDALFLHPGDSREETSGDGTALPEHQMDSTSISVGEEEGHGNIQQDSSLFSYSDMIGKENSSPSKNLKEGIDMVTSIREHEDDLVLFCKDAVELDPINSVSVEAVEKDGELISILSPGSVKDDEDDSSTVLYVSGGVLNSKKSIHLENIISSKAPIGDHFFNKKVSSGNSRRAEYNMMGLKIDEELNCRASEDDPSDYSKRHSMESCTEMVSAKDVTAANEEIIGIEGDMDPEDDELGSNFVHIVVTASRVIPDEMSEGKTRDSSCKSKSVRCTKRDKSECSCSTCETSFPSLSNLQSHLKKKHGNISQCDFCQKIFPTIGSLVDHCRDVHDGAGCFECEECGKRLKSRLSLRRHMESHQGRKEAICSKCGKTFCRWDYLIRHYQMVHAKERPYECTQCSQRFLSRGHLRNHLSVHSGERNHKCGICGKMFSRSDKLREHMFRHTSTKRHSCGMCGRSYADKRDLNKHLIREPGCQAGKIAPVKTDNEIDVSEKSVS